MLKRSLAVLLIAAIFCSLVPGASARLNKGTNHTALPSLTDFYEEGIGSFTLTAQSRFYLVSSQEPTDELKELAQFISRQFAAASLPTVDALPIVYGEERYAESGDIVLKLTLQPPVLWRRATNLPSATTILPSSAQTAVA